MAKSKSDDRDPTLVDLSLEQLNHEKALLKIPLRQKGKALRQLQKEVGDLKERYDALDLEMVSRDKAYKQLELEMEQEEAEE